MSRISAKDISIRETERGPEIVWDYGIQGHRDQATEADLLRLEKVLSERRWARTVPREKPY